MWQKATKTRTSACGNIKILTTILILFFTSVPKLIAKKQQHTER